jgi:hypothetical protein
MKTLIYTSIFALLLAGSSMLTAQNKPDEYIGLPGDNLNLFAVMNLFTESETLESFEKSLNDPERLINNLDLNGDEYVDYIMVFDYQEGNIHNIVLRVALNQNENQDVAVFIVEKYSDGSVLVQLIGDEALYGPNYIIEPNYAETPNPGYQGKPNHGSVNVVNTTYYEVAYWPVVEYIYEPYYIVWASPWYWGYYSSFWSPWRPYYWHFYFGYHYHWHSHYYAYYRPWRYHRCNCYHNIYYAHIRKYSPTVVKNINSGSYSLTYSRPERKIEGEKLFAQKFPSGIKEPSKRPSKDNQIVRQDQQKVPEAGLSNGKPENIAKPMLVRDDIRPAIDGQAIKNPNDNGANDKSRVSRDNPIQKTPASGNTVIRKPQVVEEQKPAENATSKPRRESTREPERIIERPSSSKERSTTSNTPTVSRSENSSSSSSSRPKSSESSSRESTSSSSGNSSKQSSSGSSNSSKSQDSQSSSSKKGK